MIKMVKMVGMVPMSFALVAALCAAALAQAADAPAQTPAQQERARKDAIRIRLHDMEAEVSNLMNPSRKNNPVEGLALMQRIASDPDFSYGKRAGYVTRLLKDAADNKDSTLWTNYIPFARSFAKTEPEATDKLRAEVIGLVFLADRKAGLPVADAEAAQVLRDPLCDGGTKTEAARHVARLALAAGGQEAAFAALAPFSAANPHPCARAKSWVLDECYDFEGAYRMLLDAGLVSDAAAYCNGDRFKRPDLAEKLYRDIIAHGYGTTWDENRAFDHAYDFLLPRDLGLAEKNLDARLGTSANTTNWAMRAINWQIGRGEDPVFFGDYARAADIFAFIRKACARTGTTIYPETAVAGLYALAGSGRPAEAAAVAREMAESVKPIGDGENKSWLWKTNDVFRAKLVAELLCAKGDANAVERKAREVVGRLGADRTPKQCAEAALFVGSLAAVANFEEVVRGLDAYRRSLYVPKPKKRYTVKFSKVPIDGLAGWDAAPVQAEVAHLDRSYGGNMDFLQTDVATGDRGEGIGSAKDEKRLPPPEMRVLADRNGLHFRYDIFEPEPDRLVVGEINAGSFETYIAPGDNEPYTCIMNSVLSDGCSLFGTTYDCPGHRRMNEDDRAGLKFEHRILKDRVQSYCFYSWANWLERVPRKGSEWDYEPLYWNRHGSYSWNGTESIHGRSTWGRLVFDLDDADRAAIFRPLLVKARGHYLDARKRVAGQVGIFERWDDPVLGDPAFFEACVKPIEDRLAPYCDKISSKMTDAETLELADAVLSDWWNVEYLVERAWVEWSMTRR